MRELTLLETGYLAGILLLSLVLPLLMSARNPRRASTRRACMNILWIGQALGAIAGVAALASASLAPYAFAFGATSCVCCALLMFRHFPKRAPEWLK
jgi:hypothetical protein